MKLFLKKLIPLALVGVSASVHAHELRGGTMVRLIVGITYSSSSYNSATTAQIYIFLVRILHKMHNRQPWSASRQQLPTR